MRYNSSLQWGACPCCCHNDQENTISQFSGAEVEKITPVKVIAETLPDFNPG